MKEHAPRICEANQGHIHEVEAMLVYLVTPIARVISKMKNTEYNFDFFCSFETPSHFEDQRTLIQ